MASGIYIVALKNEAPISSYSGDQRRQHLGTPVMRGDLKFGKSTNLTRRQRNYERTFGAENIEFKIVIETKSIDTLEASIKQRVANYRIVGINGRRLEWLRGLNFSALEEIVINTANITDDIARLTTVLKDFGGVNER